MHPRSRGRKRPRDASSMSLQIEEALVWSRIRVHRIPASRLVTTARAPLSIEAGWRNIVLIFGIFQAETFDRPWLAERPLNLFTILDFCADAIGPPGRRSPQPHRKNGRASGKSGVSMSKEIIACSRVAALLAAIVIAP